MTKTKLNLDKEYEKLDEIGLKIDKIQKELGKKKSLVVLLYYNKLKNLAVKEERMRWKKELQDKAKSYDMIIERHKEQIAWYRRETKRLNDRLRYYKFAFKELKHAIDQIKLIGENLNE
jgi:hypothetical protein